MSDDRDPILDACLDELLGGQRPPDLSQRILGAYQQREAAESGLAEKRSSQRPSLSAAESNPAVSNSAVPLCSLRTDTTVDAVARLARQRQRRAWRITIGASVLLAIGLIAMMASLGDRASSVIETKHQTADIQPANNPTPGNSDEPSQQVPASVLDRVARRSSEPSNTSSKSSGKGSSVDAPVSPPPAETIPRESPAEFPPAVPGRVLVDARGGASDQLRMDDRSIVDKLNALVRANWSQHNVKPVAAVSDFEWCQRAFQLAIGRPPNPTELDAFANDSRPDRKDQWLQRLLQAEPYAEEFARQWGQRWTDVFLDADAVEENNLASREGLAEYFRSALIQRKPFDEIAGGLLKATGTGTPGSSDYNGAANFWLARIDAKRIRATTDVSRLFLGRSIECQQCHDDPHFDGGKQEQFWQLNAFFHQLAFRRDGNSQFRLSDANFRGEGRQPDAAGIFFTAPDGTLKVAFPVFVNGTAIPPSGLVAQVNRREALAKFVLESPDFRRTIANRVWGMVLGRGAAAFEQTVLHNELSYPELVVMLGDQFAVQNYDLRKLISWVASSEPFQLRGEPGPVRLADQAPLFDRYYGSAGAPTAPFKSLTAAIGRFGAAQPDRSTTAKIDSLPRDLKGKDKSAVSAAPGAVMVEVGGVPTDPMARNVMENAKLTDQQKVEHLFLLTLHRLPRAREQKSIEQLFQKAGNDRPAALRTIWSALRNSEM